MERPQHSVGQEGTRAHPVGKDTGEAPGSGQAGTRLRLPRPRAGQAFLGVSRAASPQEMGAPRAAPRDPVSPAQTQRHRVQRTAKASTLALTESEPAGTVLRKQQRPDLQVQHIATRCGLARHGRSPSSQSQPAKDGTPPPASPASHPPPLGPSRAWVRGEPSALILGRRGSAGGAWLVRATGLRNGEKGPWFPQFMTKKIEIG